MDGTPDFNLLKDAYAIIDGIPETAIDLDALVSARGETLAHGTVCSPAGWLAQHPKFHALGVSLSDDDSRLMLVGEAGAGAGTPEILARIFRMPTEDAQHLFADRNTYTLGDDSGMSDKRLWQRELRDFLKQHGQLDPAFEERLETRGPFADPANPAEIRAL